MKVPIKECCRNYVRSSSDRKKYCYFYRFSVEQQKAYQNFGMYSMMSKSGAGIYLSFNTTGSKLKIKYRMRNVITGIARIIKDTGVSTCIDFLGEAKSEGNKKIKFSDSIDVMIDGKLVLRKKLLRHVCKVKFENRNNETKHVRIYLPSYFEVGIKYIKTNGEVSINNTNKKKMLCLGDSITQGFIADGPSENYVSLLSDMLHVYALNQGVGGYIFEPDSLKDIGEYYKPDIITIAYGTNDWAECKDVDETTNKVKEYLSKINTLFPHVKTYVITPIYRADMNEKKLMGDLTQMIEIIKNQAQLYPQITIIDGLKISSHNNEDFADGFLHPTSKGFEIMCDGIMNYIDSE